MEHVDVVAMYRVAPNGCSVLRYADHASSSRGTKQPPAAVSCSATKKPKRSIEKFNAAFFFAMDGYLDHQLRPYKKQLFRDVPNTIVEIGAGTGANFRYYPRGARVFAVEPNAAMHPSMQRTAHKYGLVLTIHSNRAENITLDDASVELVVSTLVLCTVTEPEQVLGEICRILVPGGTYRFLEHVASPAGTMTRRVQRIVRRPWAWVFEGCSCERDLDRTIKSAPFKDTCIHHHKLSTPFLPFNTQISGIATK